MTGNKVKFWNSVVSRFSLLFIGLIVSAILVSGYLVFTESSQVIQEYSKDRIKHNSTLASQAFYSLIHEATNDIALLSSTSIIEDFVQNPNSNNLNKINSLFINTLINKPSYFQVRLINADDEGMEIVRVDKKNNQVSSQPKFRHQAKGDKDYIKSTRKLRHGEFFYSSISLNEDFGSVSVPLTPTLRTASPIFDQKNDIKYVLVINIDLLGFYDQLNSLMGSGVKLLLLNEENRYLFAPNMNKCFGDQLKNNNFFYNDFDAKITDSTRLESEFDTMQDLDGAEVLYHIETLNYFQGRQKIYLLSVLEERLAFNSAYKVRNKSLVITLIVCLVALVIALIFTRYISAKITQVTRAISRYEESNPSAPSLILPENRNDEIGVLAKTFNGMKKRIDEQMQDLKVSLEKEQNAIQARDEFLQNMSHELRTPLNAILGLSQLLQKNNPNAEQKPIINSLQRSANNLAGLMYDVLDHQKLIEGKVLLKFKPCNIYELLHDIHASYQFDTVNKGLKFQLNASDEIKNQTYLLDALRFNQIITNLVVNAIRYTQLGAIQIRCEIQEGDLIVSVIDTGLGITSDNLSKIKERFYQIKSNESQQNEGFGLGLSIVSQLVGLFNGQLEVSSEIDKGSVFTIKIPVKKADTHDTPLNNDLSNLKPPKLSNISRILHIDDDESARLLIKNAVEQENISVIQKNDLTDVDQTLSGQKIDLIISDIMIDRASIGKKLALLGVQYPNIPIIILSALEKQEISMISKHFLQKPFELQELIDIVHVLLGSNEFDEPQLEHIYEMYDHQTPKKINYINILIKEFEQYLLRIEGVFESTDDKEWNAIKHKIITHIKGLKLNKLSAILPEHINELSAYQLEKIRNSILYLLCYFRLEHRINSED